MSYARCSSPSRACRIAMGADTPAGWVQVPIFAPGTIAIAALQIAINRLAPSYPPPGILGGLLGDARLVDVDGIIGPQTMSASRSIVAAEGIQPEVAADAGRLMQAMQQAADAKGLPSLQLQPVGPFAPGDKSAPPAPPRNTPGLPSGIPMTTIALGAVGVGVVVALTTKKKGRR